MMSEHHAPHYEDSGLPQPYHLVKPSAWPMLGSFAAGLLALGIIFFMHKVKLGDMDIGLKGILPYRCADNHVCLVARYCA
jgi:cytochrome c oxidase subunit 3